MIRLCLIVIVSVQLFAESTTIPKEIYQTYQQFKLSQEEALPIRPPENWIELTVNPPLLKKYTVDKNTTLSISKFDGEIGDDLANVNRWRRQLQLSPIQLNELSTYLSIQKINEYDVKIVRLHHQTQSFLIYWFNFDSYHLFVKVVSFDKIIKESFDLFVENQAWDRL